VLTLIVTKETNKLNNKLLDSINPINKSILQRKKNVVCSGTYIIKYVLKHMYVTETNACEKKVILAFINGDREQKTEISFG